MNYYMGDDTYDGTLVDCETLEGMVAEVYLEHPEYFNKAYTGNTITVKSDYIETFATALGINKYIKYGSTVYYGVDTVPGNSNTFRILTTSYLDVPVSGCFGNGGVLVNNYNLALPLQVYKNHVADDVPSDCVINIYSSIVSAGHKIPYKAVAPYQTSHMFTGAIRSDDMPLPDKCVLKYCEFFCIYDAYITVPDFVEANRNPTLGFGKRVARELDQKIIGIAHTFRGMYSGYKGSNWTSTVYPEVQEWTDQGYTYGTLSTSYVIQRDNYMYRPGGRVGHFTPWILRAEEVLVNGVKISPTAKYVAP